MGKCRVLENEDCVITCRYGENGHSGIDIVGVQNKIDNVIAHDDGIVIMCQTGRKNNQSAIGNESYGNFIKIKHENYYTLYAHLDRVDIELNQKVKRGQVIGRMGNTGKSFGTHLHFEVFDKYNQRENPQEYLRKSYKKEPLYEVGRYKVNVTTWLNVRSAPSIQAHIKLSSELTENARKQNKELGYADCNGLMNGAICDVFEVSGNWGKIPSGWICLDFCDRIH